ncbi:MAG: ribosome small subunit-dependent GTPase A [Planctomycetota bacterium]
MSALRGQVIFRSSREVRVLHEGQVFRCDLAGRLRKAGINPIVVGDWVEFERNENTDVESDGRVLAVEERKVWLSRRRDVGKARELILAANVDQVAGVFSVKKPRIKFGALDRILMASEYMSLPALVVINKTDLGIPDEVEDRLSVYPDLGYEILRTSAETGEGLDLLEEKLRGKATVLSGPSGAGKSSLISKVLGIDLKTGEVSEHNEKGKHTTTAVTWHPGSADSAIVDTPGFRDWALWGLEPRELAHWMPDLKRHLHDCKFNDCMHREEPGCGILGAVESGDLDPRRYRSYLGILDSVLERIERDR